MKGTGSDEDGTIAKAVLKINDKAVESVATVPFEYTLTDEQKEPGNVKISLEVTDNYGKTATDEVTVVILGQFREFTDTRDGKTYKTVKIGEQIWFAENCAYLPQVMKPSEYSAETPCYYVYDYDGNDVAAAKATENYRNEGVLYNWPAAGGNMDSKNDAIPSGIQGPCPDGWHVPSEAEWEILYKYVRDRIPENESAIYWDGSTVYNVSGHLRANVWPIKEDPDFPQLTKGGMDTYGFAIRPSGCLLGKKRFLLRPRRGRKQRLVLDTPLRRCHLSLQSGRRNDRGVQLQIRTRFRQRDIVRPRLSGTLLTELVLRISRTSAQDEKISVSGSRVSVVRLYGMQRRQYAGRG